MNSVHVQLGYFSLNCWILKRTRKGTHINYSNKKWMPATYMSKEMDGQSGWDSDNGAKIEGEPTAGCPICHSADRAGWSFLACASSSNPASLFGSVPVEHSKCRAEVEVSRAPR